MASRTYSQAMVYSMDHSPEYYQQMEDDLDVLKFTQRVYVTRIPRAPLLTLVILDLLYALIGTCLAIAAFKAVRKGPSVRDAQARLSNLAIVAESFESPAWGQDARDVDTLFAERRGEPTRRIALVKQADGKGRKYKQLVVPKDYVKRAPTIEDFLARKTRLGTGESQM